MAGNFQVTMYEMEKLNSQDYDDRPDSHDIQPFLINTTARLSFIKIICNLTA